MESNNLVAIILHGKESQIVDPNKTPQFNQLHIKAPRQRIELLLKDRTYTNLEQLRTEIIRLYKTKFGTDLEISTTYAQTRINPFEYA